MGIEIELKEMLDFIYSCNTSSNHENALLNQTTIAENYLTRLKEIDKHCYENCLCRFIFL